MRAVSRLRKTQLDHSIQDMAGRRRVNGEETWHRLQGWTKGSTPAERLAAHILAADGYTDIDPSHPLGGPDGARDIVCTRRGHRWIAAVYFPQGQHPFGETKRKFAHDASGVARHKAIGIAFVTNQQLSLKEREVLGGLLPRNKVEIYHVDRIAHMLDRPENYGIRQEFLDIEMTKEESVAQYAQLAQETVAQWKLFKQQLRKELAGDMRKFAARVSPRRRRHGSTS